MNWLSCVVGRTPTHGAAATAIAASPHPDQRATPTLRRRHPLRPLVHAVGAVARKPLLPRALPPAPKLLSQGAVRQ